MKSEHSVARYARKLAPVNANVGDVRMIRLLTILCLLLVIGCATVPDQQPRRTKYERTGQGYMCDLYVEVEGEWVRFYRNIGGYYSLIQSPDGKYIVLTHPKGSLVTTVHVFVVPSRQLLNITPWLHSRTAILTSDSYFTARRFLNPHEVEMGVSIYPQRSEEEPIRKAIEKTHFTINVDDAVEETLNCQPEGAGDSQ